MYILGPCSAESREQVLVTARQIKDVCGDVSFIFRAGVWKPRTSPNTFQGVGAEALEWLKEVKDTLGVPVATEVATPEHVRLALEAGVDYLWIGARSSANPLAVQEIANAIGVQNTEYRIQTDSDQTNQVGTLSAERSVLCQPKAVLIKNPVNADAKLWIGNIERLEKTGVPVIAVHRGCGHKPCWSMAHEVRMARPDIPMLLDPSHLSGDAKQVPGLMNKIEELGLDGAMIEVHCCPEKALSDNAQQIPPTLLRDAPYSIPCRFRVESVFSTTNMDKELSWLRAEIDELDDMLWDTIAARMDVSRRIGEWKKAQGMSPLQPERAKVIGERLKVKGEKLNLSAEFIKQIWDIIHQESLKTQLKIEN
ncbi:MAG: bifunctional 3-deoxy-7-phosphoheptulonate synthase/chorismate mutase type II [Paludibacteraceae bacterium]|nr:bifunctional 3-deoxy-7-phosphoheptulonate synthase/chorismate mutase type II [Paludibacteraceae bacterium]